MKRTVNENLQKKINDINLPGLAHRIKRVSIFVISLLYSIPLFVIYILTITYEIMLSMIHFKIELSYYYTLK